MSRFLVIPAAGRGARLGGVRPKALVELCGRPLLAWTLDALSEIAFDRTVVICAPDRLGEFRAVVGSRAELHAGGSTRSASVRAGFEALRALPGDLVCVHDAARPFVTAEETERVLAAAERLGVAIAATPIVDTIKRVDGERVRTTLDRDGLFAAGTPQAFRAELLERALAAGREATDEAALCETLGLPVVVVPVSRLGFKITTAADLEVARALLCARGTR